MEAQKPNGLMTALSFLAQSGHIWVQFGTLLLIAITGLFNWVATWKSSDRNKEELQINRRVAWEGEQRIRDDVRKQVQEIHDWIKESKDDFNRGNADSAENRKMLTELTRDINDIERRLSKITPPP